MAELFRKSSLEKLSSPEQLDKAITVSTPVSWLALIGITAIIGAVVVWSILGSLPTIVSAQGISAVQSDTNTKQRVECYVPYTYAEQIKTGMKAVVQSVNGDLRYDAEVIDISFDDAAYSDMELALGSNEIVVYVVLELKNNDLPSHSLVTAKIITEEIAPINKLFKGLIDRLKG